MSSKLEERPYGTARVSGARKAIAAAIAEEPGAFTVEDLAGRLRSRGATVALATIYRAVAAMERAGTLARVGERESTTLYAPCGPNGAGCACDAHHHHLVCTRCGSVEAVECPLDSALLDSAGDAGFVITRHEIRLYGMCRSCLRAPESER